MALYVDLVNLAKDDVLLNRVAFSIGVWAETLRAAGTATDKQKWLMKRSVEGGGPRATAEDAIWLLLAANKSNTVTQIKDASDAQIQADVDNAMEVLATITEVFDKQVPQGAGLP